MYKQCHMTRIEGSNKMQIASYIPETFAQVGRELSLCDQTGTWTHSWIVDIVSLETDEAPDWRKAVRKHRQATGDSQQKR